MENEVIDLQSALELTNHILNKSYLTMISSKKEYSLMEMTMNDYAVNLEKHAKIFHLKKLVYDPDENFLNKLITVVNVAYALQGTLITAIESNGNFIDFYIGIVAKKKKGASGEKDREALSNAFAGAIVGNFNGSDIGEFLKGESLEKFQNSIWGNVLCSVSTVPSIRELEKGNIDSYVQGLENLVDSLREKKYTLLTIADPVMLSEIAEIRHGYESIYNSLLPFYKLIRTKGSTETLSLSKTDTESYAKTIMEGITRTQGNSNSISTSNGFNLGASFILQAGFQHSKSNSATTMDSVSSSWQNSEQTGISLSSSVGSSHSRNDSIQITMENRIIKSLLDKVENNIKRMEECEGLGAFQTATYILADDKETALNVSGNFVSLMKGNATAAQVSAINCWERKEEEDLLENLIKRLQHFSHPIFRGKQKIVVSPTSIISGSELTVQLGFPKKSVNGLMVQAMHRFGRNVPVPSQGILLGKLQFMGKEEMQSVKLDLQSLTAHLFITGSTGAGKTNTICQILRELKKEKICFLVIEPAKGEYKHIFGNNDQVNVFGTNPYDSPILKINPFRFPKKIHILEHIDRLIEIFNVCWPMYAAMPAVLKDSVERAYISSGWNLDTSKNKYDKNLFPTFADVLQELEFVIKQSSFAQEVKDNYIGSLATRIKSLTNGIYGRIFEGNEIGDEILFDTDVIIDLSRVGSIETKAMIMGVLVMRLQEYRMATSGMNEKLKHITVLEEAHNLLKKTSTEQISESSNLLGKSVEMLSNAIAEVRTYGEGFIIADQAPELLDKSVIRNTNTKIIMRLPDAEDRRLVGYAANLSEDQIEELARLETGTAAIYQNNWQEPVLCHITYHENVVRKYQYKIQNLEESVYRKIFIIKSILEKLQMSLDVDMQELSKYVIDTSLSACIKIKILKVLRSNAINKIEDIQEVIYHMVCTPELKKEAEQAENIEEWKDIFLSGENGILFELEEQQQNIIMECILREEIERFRKPKEYLDLWYRYIEKEVM